MTRVQEDMVGHDVTDFIVLKHFETRMLNDGMLEKCIHSKVYSKRIHFHKEYGL